MHLLDGTMLTMLLSAIISYSLISGISGVTVGVAEPKFCSGRSILVDNTVSELNFNRYLSNLTISVSPPIDVAPSQCTCSVKLNDVVNSIAVDSNTTSFSCRDWVKVAYGSTEHEFRCADPAVGFPLGAKYTGFQLTLDDVGSSQQASILPLKVTIEPAQSSLTISCDSAVPVKPSTTSSVSSTTSVSSDTTSMTSSSTESSVNVSTTAAPQPPSSEANYTPLVIGLVAVGVIAGSCVVCIILCRMRRQSKENKERFHQTVYRKASKMYRDIIASRPLPTIPQSIRRLPESLRRPRNTRKHIEAMESGLYDSIRSDRKHAGGKKPEVTQQFSNGSSVCYIHPVGIRNNEQSVQPVENDGGAYLTMVGNRKVPVHGTDSSSTYVQPVVDYVKADKESLKESISYLNVPKQDDRYMNLPMKGKAKTPLKPGTACPTNISKKDGVYMSMKGQTPEKTPYLTMGGLNTETSDSVRENKSTDAIDNSKLTIIVNEDQSTIQEPGILVLESAESVHVAGDSSSAADDTFPRLLNFEPFVNENPEAKEQDKCEPAAKVKRYVRELNNPEAKGDVNDEPSTKVKRYIRALNKQCNSTTSA